MLQQVAVLSAAQLNNVTIFGLGIMPYISASIIFQLLGSVIPALEELKKEGQAGQKKINEYTRYATVGLCIIQSWIFVGTFAEGQKLVDPDFTYSGFREFNLRLENNRCSHHDCRNRVPHVAR